MPPVFTVGWVCALSVELAAVEAILDEQYDPLPSPPTDTNLYTFGRIGVHNVVAACLPAGKMGNNSAADVASQMRTRFPSLRFGMLVGIGGGVPNEEHDIRLGDVVISQPAAQHGGVVQFDFGKTVSGGEFTRTGSLDAPPTILLNALAKLQANILLGKARAMDHLSSFADLQNFACPGPQEDVLYSASSQHMPGPTCASCRQEDVVVRQARTTLDPSLFFGTIASGNQVMKDAPTRDRISRDLGGVLCFEMEAAGLMNNFGCLVIRGICDYADAHKNKQWQPYAAAVAAACAKELLLLIPQVISATENSQMAHPTLAVRSTVSSLSDEDKDCLRSLAFPEQESRGQEIHFAQNTCQWLLMDYQYWEWTKKARGLFWVKGNPGTGKSALMKCAATSMRHKQPGVLVLSYFIHGRGTDLQKSVLGVFRALLNTMLASFPQYLSHLTKIFKDREERYGSYQEKRWNWSVQELQDCMLETLSKGAKDKRVIIFVDALDECGEHDAKALLNFFRDLMQRVEMEEAEVRICFSSRHYPILGSNTIPTVSVEEQNGMDIRSVVHERLKQVASERRRQQIEEQILSKSQGGFQWAMLVTEKILDGDATGIRETNLLKMLTSIPETLDGLYGNILSRCNGVKKEQMVKLFQWILFARRPLSSQELRESLSTDKDMASATIDLLRRHDSWVEDLSQFETYVKNLSRGLVEFQDRDVWEQYEADAEPWNREAQFIHQSVADYLVEKFLPYQDDRTTSRSVVGDGHFEISRSCFKYITMSDMQGVAGLSRGSLSVRFPLAPYAVQSLFHHIRQVEQEGLTQLDLLSLIQWDRRPSSLQQTAQLWNVLDPDYGHAPRGWPFIGATPLHVLIAFGTESALDAVLQEENPEIDQTDAGGNTPLLLAIREGHPKIALMLLDRSFEWNRRHIRAIHESTNQDNQNIDQKGNFCVNVNASNNEGDTPLSVALTMTKAGELILRLIKAGADVKRPRQKAQLFVYAIRYVDSALFMDLITKYGSPDGAVYFISREMSSGNNNQILEVFLSELLKAGANTSRSRAFNGFSETNNTDGHYRDVDPWDEFDDEFHAYGDDDIDEDEDEEAILLASREGQTSAVNLLLSHNVSVDSLNSNGESPLTLAVSNGHTEVVQLLLEKGATGLNTIDDLGNTPLTLAVSYRHTEVVQLLLEKGANPDTMDDLGNTPLTLAVSKGHTEVIQLLLENGATGLNTVDDEGNTPLTLAVSKGHTEVIQLLLEKGATGLNTADKEGNTPLVLAVSKGHIEVIQLLFEKGADPDSVDDEGKTPLHHAVLSGDIEMVQLLLEYDADPDSVDDEGKTPLYHAVLSGDIEVIQLLLEYNVDPDSVDDEGKTPLYHAVLSGDIEMVQLLFEKGATSLNIVDEDGYTPLILAIFGKDLRMVKLLLNHGANPDPVEDFGFIPLHEAVIDCSFEIVEVLLEKGADPNMRRKNKQIPLCREVVDHCIDFIDFLLDIRADPYAVDDDGQTPFLLAVSAGHLEIVRLLLAKGASLDITDNKEKTPLSIAVASGHLGIIELLLAEGANPDIADQDGQTQIHSAVALSRLDVIQLLLAKGASLDITDKKGKTPLISAAANGHLVISRLLLAEGASLNATDASGGTPLISAAANGHLEIVKLLLAEGAEPKLARNDGETALLAALAGKHREVACLLYEKNIDLIAADDLERLLFYLTWANEHGYLNDLLLLRNVNPDILSDGGWTPLDLAAAGGHLEAAKVLLENSGANRANPNTAGKNGSRPLSTASARGHLQVVTLLLEKGAYINATDDLGRTALHMALLGEHLETVKLLLLAGADPEIASN